MPQYNLGTPGVQLFQKCDQDNCRREEQPKNGNFRKCRNNVASHSKRILSLQKNFELIAQPRSTGVFSRTRLSAAPGGILPMAEPKGKA
jgi:hypothetical protein